MQKQPKMELVYVYTNNIRWRIAKNELPDRKTRYAGKFGVPVLAFDLDEFIDSGSCDPASVCYDFKKKQFLSLAYGSKGTVWLPTLVTHWLPLPPNPVSNEHKSRTVKSKLGFKYFKGSDNRAKKFVEI